MFKSDNILLLMRHASSNWPQYSARDFDRPLDFQGESQPFDIAEQLNSLGVDIDRALISSALRATQTFKKLCQKLVKSPEAFFEARLYQALVPDVKEVLQEHSSSCDSLLLIGHNPSLTELSYQLTKDVYEFKPSDLVIFRAKKESLALSLESNFGFCVEKILTPRF